ncbi:MAG: sensor histidine kinase, partial [Aureispira sp.]
FQEALDWHKQYTSIKDSLYNVETTTQIAAMQAEYDNLQKEKEIQQLSLENKNISIANKTMALESAFKSKQLYLSLSVIVLLLALLGMLWWYRQQQQKTILLEQQLEELLNEQEIKILETALKAQQKERKHLGKEVHDTIGTILATLHYQHLAGQKAIDDPVLFQKDYQLIGQLIGQAADEVHRIACEMDMGEQFAFELKPAIEHLIESIGATKQFELTFNYTGKSFKLPRNLALTVYRVTREILANVLKHAQATKVVVQIVQTNSKVILAVEDNGRGFDTKTTKEGIGLRSMRERIASLNGNMNIESTPQSGTSVVATIPIMGQLSD